MKTKFLTKGIAGVVFAFLLYACSSIFNSPQNLSKTICMDYSSIPMETLGVNLVHEMVDGYKSNQLESINLHTPPFNSMEVGDAHAIWFDIETLKKFIYHLEMNAKSNNKGIKSEHLGLRIYYASYPGEDEWTRYPDLSNVTQTYGKRHTLVMIPTIRVGDNDMDFNPKDPATYTNGLRGLENYGAGSSNLIPALSFSKSLPPAPGSPATAGQNHGSLFPPEDQSGEGF